MKKVILLILLTISFSNVVGEENNSLLGIWHMEYKGKVLDSSFNFTRESVSATSKSGEKKLGWINSSCNQEVTVCNTSSNHKIENITAKAKGIFKLVDGKMFLKATQVAASLTYHTGNNGLALTPNSH